MPAPRIASSASALILLVMLGACDAGGPTEPAVAAAGTAASAKGAVEGVCHYNSDAGAYTRLDLHERAAAAHRAHGDGTPATPVAGREGYMFDDACQPVFVGIATLEQLTPITAVYATGAFTGSGEGDVTGNVIPVDINLVGSRDSDSGCQASDFAGLDFSGPNDIALIQRGGALCVFGDKARNAYNAGAEAVIIFNQGNTPDREGLIVGTAATLGDGTPATHTIPIVGATFADGVALADAGSTARVSVDLTE